MKRVLAILLALMLLGTAQAEIFVVNMYGEENGSYGLLVDEDGTMYTDTSSFGSIYIFSDKLQGIYAATPYDYSSMMTEEQLRLAVQDELPYYEYMLECLLDERGNMLTGFEYVNFYYDEASGVIIGQRTEGCDVLSLQGEVLMRTDYLWIGMNGQGGYLAVRAEEDTPYDGEMCPLVFVSADGTERELGYEGSRWSCRLMQDGYYYVDVGEDTMRGIYLDAQGREAFELDIAYGENFEYGMAIVRDANDYCGLIDRQGRYILPHLYTTLQTAMEYPEAPMIAVTADGVLELYERGTMRCITRYRPEEGAITYAFHVNAGMIMAYDDAGATLLKNDGTPVFRQDTTESGDSASVWYGLEDGSCPERIVMENGTWPERRCVLVDLQGRQTSGEWKIIEGSAWQDGKGRFAVVDYDIVDSEYGPTVDWMSYRYGLIDENGNVIHETKYDSLTVLSMDRCWVQLGDLSGMIDNDGRWLATVSRYEYLMD